MLGFTKRVTPGLHVCFSRRVFGRLVVITFWEPRRKGRR